MITCVISLTVIKHTSENTKTKFKIFSTLRFVFARSQMIFVCRFLFFVCRMPKMIIKISADSKMFGKGLSQISHLLVFAMFKKMNIVWYFASLFNFRIDKQILVNFRKIFRKFSTFDNFVIHTKFTLMPYS